MSIQDLYLTTPLSQAVFEFFNEVEKEVAKKTTVPGSVRAYLFGGCALHIHTNARGSNDIDVEFSASRNLAGEDIVLDFKEVFYLQEGRRKQLALDRNFTPMLGPLHEDYQDDAIQLQTRHTHSPLWVYVVTPEDLATSKLGRFSERDREDILTLLRMKRMTIESFQKRALEAISYCVGNEMTLHGSLQWVVREFNG